MTWSERTVEGDGVRLSCRDWGGFGPPVVLLHGLAGHAGEWDNLARCLGEKVIDASEVRHLLGLRDGQD